MNNQNSQRRRNQRWQMNKQLNNRRRVNLWKLEKRVSYLEGRDEVLTLDLENTHDLMKALELKVQGLLEEKKARQQTACNGLPPCLVKFWRWLRGVLCSKGTP